ncbi:MAG: hypothetical protein QOG22_4151, partial [Pseudonocardiales bacterium]|nr:hypothetical protein [Pseudonocardiales bacterium]
GFPATRVHGIKEKAWYMSYGPQMGELRVTLPNRDVFVVSIFFRGLRSDAEQLAVGTYKAARSRLLK